MATSALMSGNTHKNMKKRLSHVNHTLLQRFDPVLYEHLQENFVPPELYLIRWIRCLFGREFTLTQVMRVWDWLLCSQNMELVDYLCVAMQCYIRFRLLDLQGPYILNELMNYPPPNDRQLGELLIISQGMYAGEITTLVVWDPSTLLPLYPNPTTDYQLFLNEFWVRKDLQPQNYRGIKVYKRAKVVKAGRKLWLSNFKGRPSALKAYLDRAEWP